jgi:hypothetical protein
MRWRISQRDFRAGCGVVYSGKTIIPTSDRQLAHRKARFLQMKVNTTEAEEQKEWIEQYNIKDFFLKEKAKGLKLTSQAYLNIKEEDFLLQHKKEEGKSWENNTRWVTPHVIKKTDKEIRNANKERFARASYGSD